MVAAATPPPGIQSNFVNPPLAAENMYTSVVVGLAISGLFLLMRVYTKGYILRKFGADDGMTSAWENQDTVTILANMKQLQSLLLMCVSLEAEADIYGILIDSV